MNARRVVLVTGGARRVGAAIVRSFAEREYDVLLHHGNSPADAESLARTLQDTHGIRVEVVQEDLADATAPARIVNAAMQSFGRLDVVISSASVMTARPFDEVTPEEWTHTEAVNTRAPFFLMQAAARVMTEGGSIVQLSDHLAFENGFPHLIPHQVSKSALTQLVRAMATALAPRIRVNAVKPGLVLAPDSLSDAVLTKFIAGVPLARSGTTDDVVRAIHYLTEATYVTGELLTVDGGRHLTH